MGNQDSICVDPNSIANYDWNVIRPRHVKPNEPSYSSVLFQNRLRNQNHTPVRKTKSQKVCTVNVRPKQKHVRRLKFDEDSRADDIENVDINQTNFYGNELVEYALDCNIFDTPNCDDHWSADPWNKLSDEIVLQVFKWLPKTVLIRCLRVCKRWNRLGLDETLWRRLDLTSKTLVEGELGMALSRGVAVLRLAKADIKTPIYRDVDLNKEQRFSKVQFLDLSMSCAPPEALEQIVSTCHVLKKLSLENCAINNRVCRAIGQNRQLEVLNLSMCEGITENGLVPICNNLQKLDALNIGWTNMSKGAVVYLVICLSPTLTKLNLAGCRETLEDDDIHQLCSSCPNLKELDLSDATLLTGQSVEYIASMLHGLEYIALSRCYHVMPSTLPLLQHIPTLLALDVFGMLKECAVQQLRAILSNIEVNKFPFSSIARPTTGIRRTSIWGLRVRDSNV